MQNNFYSEEQYKTFPDTLHMLGQKLDEMASMGLPSLSLRNIILTYKALLVKTPECCTLVNEDLHNLLFGSSSKPVENVYIF